MILGVCEWLSGKLNVETRFLRIGFIVFALLGGSGVLLYLILFLIKAIKNE